VEKQKGKDMELFLAMLPFLLILLAVAAWNRSLIKRRRQVSEMVCTRCGSRGGRRGLRGNAGIELLLWCLFILPGLAYTMHRTSNRPWVCRTCGAEAMVPADSPIGKKVVRELAAG